MTDAGLAQALIPSLSYDYIVYAVDINPEIYTLYSSKTNVIPLVADITMTDALIQIKTEIEKTTQIIDLIIHFAGIVCLGSCVEVSPQVLEKVLQVNLIGMYRVNFVFFPLIQKPGGRIIMVSSEYGRLLGLPFHSFYTLSKHALEIYSDSLRRELASFGIKVIKIRPGAFATKMQKQIRKQFDDLLNTTVYFQTPLIKMSSLMDRELIRAKNPNKIVRTFQKAISSRHPRLAYNVGQSWKMKFLNGCPARMQDWLLNHVLQSNHSH